MKPFALVLVAGLISGAAFAAENEPTPPTAAPVAVEPPPAASSAPAASESHPSHEERHSAAPSNAAPSPEPSKPEEKTKARETAQKPSLTRQAFARLLAAEIRKRTPESASDKTGHINVAFTIGASGRVVSHKVWNTANPALEPIVGQIRASVHTPPPPGGSFSAVQEFNFH